ncbi:MAG: hypothetical protein J2P57_18605 [Acidimicrobiaceae bacterium]|nr:hypothetical protein [Acidimicrobiaceae bacterium]
MRGNADRSDRHRALYLLERGTWRARCRLCDWEVSNPVRQHAAAMFRQHIRAVKLGEAEPGRGMAPEPGA